MKTNEYKAAYPRYSTTGRTYSAEAGKSYTFRRRRSHKAATRVEFDEIPVILLPETGYRLTAEEIQADLSYGRD